MYVLKGYQDVPPEFYALQDAILRTITVAKQAGIKALLVHALSDEARKFYLQCGFIESPLDPMLLMITLKDAQHHLTA